nr:tRNA lysidine(34) synthetase TilS [Clostridiales bacterium]
PKFIDLDKVRGKLVLRCRQPGDTFSSAVRGNTKGLKKLFQEAGIGAGERDRIPLLCDDSGIIWIPGQGPSAAVCSDGMTVKIIHIAITERKDHASGC